MIHCPYCGAEMEDDSQSCHRCRSLLVSGEAAPRTAPLPRWIHPLAVLAFLIVSSVGLLAVSLKPWSREASAEGIVGDPLPGGAPTAAAGNPNQPPAGALAPGATEAPAGDDLYTKVNDYVSAIQDAQAQADQLAGELDRMYKKGDKTQLAAMRDKLNQLQPIVNKVRALSPPEALAQAHIRLSNSMAVRQRAYRNLSMYLQSGDMNRLDRGRKDLETAEQSQAEAMAEILAYRDKIPAPPPPPAPEPAAPAEPPPPAPAAPNPPVLPPPTLEPPLDPLSPVPEDVAPAEGASAADGGSVAPAAGGTTEGGAEVPLVPDDGSLPQLPRLKQR
jgi:hypothetical protein